MLDVQIGDVLTMKKNHPCGENRFLVLRVGRILRSVVWDAAVK